MSGASANAAAIRRDHQPEQRSSSRVDPEAVRCARRLGEDLPRGGRPPVFVLEGK